MLRFTERHELTSLWIDGVNGISDSDVDEFEKLSKLTSLSIQSELEIHQHVVNRLKAMSSVNVSIDQLAARVNLMRLRGFGAATSTSRFSAPVDQ